MTLYNVEPTSTTLGQHCIKSYKCVVFAGNLAINKQPAAADSTQNLLEITLFTPDPHLAQNCLHDLSEACNLNLGMTVHNLVVLYLIFAADLIFFAEKTEAIQEQTGTFKYPYLCHNYDSKLQTRISKFTHKYDSGSASDY